MTDRVRFETGLAAEEIVARTYKRLGAQRIAERVRTDAGEIDLILKLNDTLIFVEVKARRSLDAAAQSLGSAQRSRIVIAAQVWIDQQGLDPLAPCRFDAALVDGKGRVETIENAFGDGF